MTRVPLLDDLAGEVALVTGANRGLGAALAQGLADAGARVYAGARRPGEVAARDDVVPVALDVTDDASVDAAFTRVEEDAGRLDVLVNNAGAAAAFGHTLADEPWDVVEATLAVDVAGSMRVTRRALPLLFARRGARVVNVSAAMAQLSEPMGGETAHLAQRAKDGAGGVEAPSYRIGKAALNALTVYLHHEYHASHGLLANAFTPGWVASRMGGEDADRSPEEGAATGLWLAHFAPDAPSGRFWRDRAAIPW